MQANTGVPIRPATVADAKPMALILRELGWFAHINEEMPADTERRIVGHLEPCCTDDSHTVLVAENSAGTVIGYIAVHWLPYMMLTGPEGYISELFVLESERGKGVGRALLETVKGQAVKRGCARLQLVTGKDRESYTIYRKLGWKERPGIADFILPLL